MQKHPVKRGNNNYIIGMPMPKPPPHLARDSRELHSKRYFRRREEIKVASLPCMRTPTRSTLHPDVVQVLHQDPTPCLGENRPHTPVRPTPSADDYPGSAPLPGHVDPDLGLHESRLHHAIFTLQAQDHPVIVDGHQSDIVSEDDLRSMLERISSICDTSRNNGAKDLAPISADVEVLGTVTLLRFLGESHRMGDLSTTLISEKDRELLPEVCLIMASKFEHDDFFKPTDSILTAAGVQKEAHKERKKEIGRLEWRVFGAVGQRMNTATPVTFLHLYVALAVARGTFTQADVGSMGKLALEMTMQLVNNEALAHATSSEIAAAATCCATFQKLGAAAARKMTTVVSLQWRMSAVLEMVSSLCPGTTGVFVAPDSTAKAKAKEKAKVVPRKMFRSNDILGNFQRLLHEIATVVSRLNCCDPQRCHASSVYSDDEE